MTVADLIHHLRGVAHDAEVVVDGETLLDARSLSRVTIVANCDRPEAAPLVILTFD